MSVLSDDTALLLAMTSRDPNGGKQAALDDVSEAVITRIALMAKADAYRRRIQRRLATAACLGANLEELSAAAGLSRTEVLGCLDAVPRDLYPESVRRRLARDAQAAREQLPAEPVLPPRIGPTDRSSRHRR